jgi:hypothetical protein
MFVKIMTAILVFSTCESFPDLLINGMGYAVYNCIRTKQEKDNVCWIQESL